MENTLKVITLNCDNCGGPLEGAAWRKKLKCVFCGSEVLVKPKEPAHRFIDHDELRMTPTEKRLKRLDRAWKRRRDDLMVVDSRGRSHVPAREDAFMVGGLFLIFGTFAILMVKSVIFSIAIVFIAVFTGIRLYKMADDYELARRRFRKRRRQLLQQIREESGAD